MTEVGTSPTKHQQAILKKAVKITYIDCEKIEELPDKEL